MEFQHMRIFTSYCATIIRGFSPYAVSLGFDPDSESVGFQLNQKMTYQQISNIIMLEIGGFEISRVVFGENSLEIYIVDPENPDLMK